MGRLRPLVAGSLLFAIVGLTGCGATEAPDPEPTPDQPRDTVSLSFEMDGTAHVVSASIDGRITCSAQELNGVTGTSSGASFGFTLAAVDESGATVSGGVTVDDGALIASFSGDSMPLDRAGKPEGLRISEVEGEAIVMEVDGDGTADPATRQKVSAVLSLRATCDEERG